MGICYCLSFALIFVFLVLGVWFSSDNQKNMGYTKKKWKNYVSSGSFGFLMVFFVTTLLLFDFSISPDGYEKYANLININEDYSIINSQNINLFEKGKQYHLERLEDDGHLHDVVLDETKQIPYSMGVIKQNWGEAVVKIDYLEDKDSKKSEYFMMKNPQYIDIYSDIQKNFTKEKAPQITKDDLKNDEKHIATMFAQSK